MTLRESIIHGLRSRGWSKVEAEDEADERIARMEQPATPAEEPSTPETEGGRI